MTGAADAPADAIGTSSRERVGFVGPGTMGWPMAEAADDLGGDADRTEAHKHWRPGRPLAGGNSTT